LIPLSGINGRSEIGRYPSFNISEFSSCWRSHQASEVRAQKPAKISATITPTTKPKEKTLAPPDTSKTP
jgi:hypothetical protein